MIRRGTFVAALAALLLVAPVAGIVASGSPRARAAPPPRPAGRVLLASQTAWAVPGNDFDLGLHLQGVTGADKLELAVRVYPAVTTRSEFEQTLGGRVIGTAVASPPPSPVSDLHPDESGTVHVTLPLQDPQQPRDVTRIALGRRDGVYPVRIELRGVGDGPVLDQFTTHLVYTASDAGSRLGVALVLPVHAPPSLQTRGARRLRSLDDLVALGHVLDAHHDVAFTLAPTPETLQAIAATDDERVPGLLAALRRSAVDHQVVAGSYVPTNVSSLLTDGLDDEMGVQLRSGAAVVDEVLRTSADRRTWLAADRLDQASLSWLGQKGFDRLVADPAQLPSVPAQKLTPTRPYLLDAGRAPRQEAATVDGSLAAHFDNNGNPVLLAHQFLADLAVLYLDQPGSGPRAVVALPPSSWTPNRTFLDTILSGLASSGVVEPVSLGQLFEAVTPARVDASPQTRRRATTHSPPPSDFANAVRSARRRLDAFASVVDRDNPVYGMLNERLLVSESSDLHSVRQREAYVTAVQRGVAAQVRAIQMPRGRSITLTAARGEIPVTFRNQTGHPVHVVVRVESEKLSFPRGDHLRLDLTRLNTTERFEVRARTSGAFPLRVTLQSPDGRLVIGRTHLTVRSTATSGVGLVLSLGAAVFLAVWWGRHALRGRRARRLVPA